MKKITLLYLFLSAVVFGVVACEALLPAAPADDALLDGPIAELTPEQNALFLAGDVAFNDEIFTPATGLGPTFVASSCGSCHAGDGKGTPFTTLVRFGQHDDTGNQFMERGGPQLQNRAIPGHTAELLPAGAAFSKFTPPANTGLGMLGALSDAQILANADPTDKDGDGISGVPNWIDAPDYFKPQWFHKPHNGQYVGRFGKKAAAIDLLHQTVNAYKQDMGITSEFDSEDPINYSVSGQAGDGVDDPEVSTAKVNAVVFYLRTLKVPVQRTPTDPMVVAGKQLFISLDCGKCHTPDWKTPQSDIAVLSDQTFAPYTDLLLHDMGAGLDDGYTEGRAKTTEWKTPALWGLGLSQNSQGGRVFLLHDGRAHSVDEAIRLHGGEASRSVEKYAKLAEAERGKLLRFLDSL
ncbi:di-heme oxidoredictase family protein [Spirosoma luteum]|uniref:di-heme oxidoredictase family protein n=1 Tax=Spirosoma luteum TaxID=431553 RepID=UPI00036597C9|nr:di-heme oxidoredictase family protein [Spirosoma luteum]